MFHRHKHTPYMTYEPDPSLQGRTREQDVQEITYMLLNNFF